MKKQPKISEKTRQKFIDAFWTLTKEKPVSKIAVSELAKRAGYNRSTFYEYFLDTNDILAYAETELLEQIKELLRKNSPETTSPDLLFQTIFSALNEKIYLFLGANGDSSFLEKVKAEMLPVIEVYFQISKDIPEFDYLVCFASSAMFGLLQYWNEKGKDLSVEEISIMMQTLVLHGLTSRMTPQDVLTTSDIAFLN